MDQPVNFLLIGDWGMANANQALVASQMAEYAHNVSADFVVALGDNFYENGVVSDTDPQWKNTFRDVYSHASLDIPWYAILGK